MDVSGTDVLGVVDFLVATLSIGAQRYAVISNVTDAVADN
jgi:hypothetical protein